MCYTRSGHTKTLNVPVSGGDGTSHSGGNAITVMLETG